jgi:hypothetical protein
MPMAQWVLVRITRMERLLTIAFPSSEPDPQVSH